MKPKVLVTGAAGFMGSHLCEELSHYGAHDVVAVDNLSGGTLNNLRSDIPFYQVDITDYAGLDSVFKKERPDYVYHLAAYAAEGLSHNIRGFNYHNNLVGSANVISCCVKHLVLNLIFTSSIAVYGKGQTPFNEFQTPEPDDPYGLAKLTVEKELELARKRFGLNYIIFRPHNVYGPRQNLADPFRNVVGIFMNQIMQGKPLTIFGDGSQIRSFSYIDDVIKVISRAHKYQHAIGKAFNVGTDDIRAVGELGELISEIAGVPFNPVYLNPRQEVEEAYCDHSLSEIFFGPHQVTPTQVGLTQMWRWAQRVGPQAPTPCPAPLELEAQLPDGWHQHFGLLAE